MSDKKQKSRLIALMLGLFLGFFGADRFYLGKKESAILKAITFGGLTFWWFIDNAIMMIDAFLYSLGKETGFIKDTDGNELKHGLSMYRFKNGEFIRDWK